MEGKVRRVSARSLENLKKGAQARYQGKVRQNVTIKPNSLEWLKKGGNISGRIDELVAAALSGELKSNNVHGRKNEENLTSNNAHNQIEALKAELEQLRHERDQLESEVDRLHAKADDLGRELTNLKEQPQQQPNLEVTGLRQN